MFFFIYGIWKLHKMNIKNNHNLFLKCENNSIENEISINPHGIIILNDVNFRI